MIEQVEPEKIFIQKEVTQAVVPEVVMQENNHVSQILDEYFSTNEEWRNYGFIGKLKFYYKHNGMKKTVTYGAKKIIRKA